MCSCFVGCYKKKGDSPIQWFWWCVELPSLGCKWKFGIGVLARKCKMRAHVTWESLGRSYAAIIGSTVLVLEPWMKSLTVFIPCNERFLVESMGIIASRRGNGWSVIVVSAWVIDWLWRCLQASNEACEGGDNVDTSQGFHGSNIRRLCRLWVGASAVSISVYEPVLSLIHEDCPVMIADVY